MMSLPDRISPSFLKILAAIEDKILLRNGIEGLLADKEKRA